MATETAIAMSAYRNQTPACERLFAEFPVSRTVPDLIEFALLETTHREGTWVAGEHCTIHLDAGMKPGNIARQFLPYSFTYPIS